MLSDFLYYTITFDLFQPHQILWSLLPRVAAHFDHRLSKIAFLGVSSSQASKAHSQIERTNRRAGHLHYRPRSDGSRIFFRLRNNQHYIPRDTPKLCTLSIIHTNRRTRQDFRPILWMGSSSCVFIHFDLFPPTYRTISSIWIDMRDAFFTAFFHPSSLL